MPRAWSPELCKFVAIPNSCGSPMLLALGAPLLLLLALVLWLLLALVSQLYRVRRHLCLSPPATAAPD